MTRMLFQAMWTQRECRNMHQLSREQNQLEGKGWDLGEDGQWGWGVGAVVCTLG